MRTLRLPDPFPRGKPPRKLEWGSSAWAADSCLVEWSTLEREWLEPQPRTVSRREPAAWAWGVRDVPAGTWLALLALTLFGLGCFL